MNERIYRQSLLPFEKPPEKIQLLPESLLLEGGDGTRRLIIETAISYIGYPASNYKGPNNGLEPERGFDCSGFVLYVLRQVRNSFPSLYLPDHVRHAKEMFKDLGVAVNDERIRYGDLAFYTKRGFGVTHVGIYCGQATDGRPYIVHSPGKSGQHVRLSRLTEESIPVTRPSQLYNRNPVGFKRLTRLTNNSPHSPWESGWRQVPI